MRRDMTANDDPLGYASVKSDTFSDVAENNKKQQDQKSGEKKKSRSAVRIDC